MLFNSLRRVPTFAILGLTVFLATPGAWAAKGPKKHAAQEKYPAMEEGSVAVQVKESADPVDADPEESSDSEASRGDVQTQVPAQPQTLSEETETAAPTAPAPIPMISSNSERAVKARIREANLARKKKSHAPGAAQREAAREAMRKSEARAERGIPVQSAGSVAAPQASAIDKRLDHVNQEIQAIRDEFEANQRGGERGAYEPVPSDKRDSLARRLQIVERLIREHGRAYDYRIHTSSELETILRRLEQPISAEQEETTSDAL